MAGRCCVKRGSIAFAKSQLTMIGLLFASGASSSSSSPSSSHGNHATKWHLVTRLLGLPLISRIGNKCSKIETFWTLIDNLRIARARFERSCFFRPEIARFCAFGEVEKDRQTTLTDVSARNAEAMN